MDQQQQQSAAPVAVATAVNDSSAQNNGGQADQSSVPQNIVSASASQQSQDPSTMTTGPIFSLPPASQHAQQQQQQQFLSQMFADPNTFAAAAASSPLFPPAMLPLMGLPPNMLNASGIAPPPPCPQQPQPPPPNTSTQGDLNAYTNTGGTTTTATSIPGSSYSNGFAIPGVHLDTMAPSNPTSQHAYAVNAPPQLPMDTSQQQQQQNVTQIAQPQQQQQQQAQYTNQTIPITSEASPTMAAAQSPYATVMPNTNLSPPLQPQMAPIAPSVTTNTTVSSTSKSSPSLVLPSAAPPNTSSGATGTGGRGSKRNTNTNLTSEQRAKQNRDRNREHARSTRLRKKAYVNKLKELVEGLHAERAEQSRQRRIDIEQLAEKQRVRRGVVRDFLRFHAGFEVDGRKWRMVLEDGFWMKQPVTPYRSFRRGEIEYDDQQECRISRGVEAMIRDASSMSVMVEEIGSRSARWMQIKREDFLIRQESKNPSSGSGTTTTTITGGGSGIRRNGQHMPHSIVRQNSRLQHAVSSLSSSSGSSTGNGSGGEEERQLAQRRQQQQQQLLQNQHSHHATHQGMIMSKKGGTDKSLSKTQTPSNNNGVVTIKEGGRNNNNRRLLSSNKVSSSSSSSDSRSKQAQQQQQAQAQQQQQAQHSNDFHDYHAPSLPDPMLDSGGSSTGSDSPTVGESRNTGSLVVGANETNGGGNNAGGRRGTKHVCTDSSSGDEVVSAAKPSAAKKRKLPPSNQQMQQQTAVTHNTAAATTTTNTEPMDLSTAPNSITKMPQTSGLPPNIAKSGGISHSIRSVLGSQPTPPTINPNTNIAHTASKMASSFTPCPPTAPPPNTNPPNGNSRLSTAPAISLPPFVGIGKRANMVGVNTTTTVGAAIVSNKTNMAAAVGGSSTVVKGGMIGGGSTVNPLAAANTAASANISSSTTATAKSPSLVLSTTKSSSNGGAGTTGPNIIPTRDSSSSRGTNTTTNSNNSAISAASTTGVNAAAILVAADNDTASSTQSSSQLTQLPQIQAYYHINEDDMLITDDVLMCPFIFRSQDAVLCGALSDCIMPGMLRASFSSRNKLLSLEMVYDSMGFIQQLERASCCEETPQVIPNSLEMALSPNTNEARAITLAKPPFQIVSVNEAWTRTTKYTQMEVEGKEMSVLHGKKTDPDAGKRPGKPVHEMVEVAKGNCACSVNFHYDKYGKDFVDFVSSYPLTNANDEITHILHICKELPEPTTPENLFPDAPSSGSVSFQE